MRRWINRMELRCRRYAIPNLMTYIVAGMALVFMLDILGLRASFLLYLNRALVFRGQIWRLASFIFLPPSTSILWILFSLYFYWMVGSALERYWGAFRFNLFYLTGVLGTILGALITGSATNVYLNFSLFLAFAILNPDFQIMVFFLLPLKIKYLAIVNLVFYAIMMIMGDWATRLSILVSLLNIALFFGGDLINQVRTQSRYWRTRANFRRNYRR